MPRRALVLAIAAVTAVAALAGCRPTGSASPVASSAATPLTVGLGYIPSVQFAPFYLAQQRGYYAEAGLVVTFENKIDPDLVTLVGQGAIDVGVADGTSVIPAVSQGIPIRYIATIYGTYPSIVFAKASAGITSASGLAGKKIGIPGRYGSSWIMLQALLDSAGLSPDDVTIVEYPDFGQGVAVQQDAVDAATGFANNEPVQLELTGEKAVVLHVDRIVPLPGPGLIAGTSTIETKQAAVEAFVAATLRAMEVIAADPKVGLDAAIAAVPELGSNRETPAAILDATIATWRAPGGSGIPFGTIDRAGWQASVAFLEQLDARAPAGSPPLVPNPVTVDDLLRDDLLPNR
jgi:putative riboflavin transport system substrate-binding protein